MSTRRVSASDGHAPMDIPFLAFSQFEISGNHSSACWKAIWPVLVNPGSFPGRSAKTCRPLVTNPNPTKTSSDQYWLSFLRSVHRLQEAVQQIVPGPQTKAV